MMRYLQHDTLKKCGIKIIGALGAGFMLFSILLIIAGI